MRAVVARELAVIARRPALTIALCAYVGLLVGFLLTWSQGVPLLPGATLYDQQRLVDWMLITVMLPWVAVRCTAPDGRDRLASTSALTALRPSSIVLGKIAGLTGVLALFVCAGLPAVFLAQQMSAVPAIDAARDTAALFGAAALIAASTVSWTLAVDGRLAAWIGATFSVGLVLWALWQWAGPSTAGIGAALLAAALTLWTAGASDRSLRYCHE